MNISVTDRPKNDCIDFSKLGKADNLLLTIIDYDETESALFRLKYHFGKSMRKLNHKPQFSVRVYALI